MHVLVSFVKILYSTIGFVPVFAIFVKPYKVSSIMKIQKKIITLFVVLMFTGCDPLYHVFFSNISERSIIVNYYTSFYPDTTIMDYWNEIPIESQDTSMIYEVIGTLPDFFRPNSDDVLLDTVSIFIYDADSINYYSWDTVVKYYMILQRYDISMSDLEELEKSRNFSLLFFPPTEAMKHIHMWPPYGTYDRNGRRKEVKH